MSRHPLRWFRVVGIVRFGGVQTLGPIELVVFDLPVAQELFDKQGYYDEIYVAARPGARPPGSWSRRSPHCCPRAPR